MCGVGRGWIQGLERWYWYHLSFSPCLGFGFILQGVTSRTAGKTQFDGDALGRFLLLLWWVFVELIGSVGLYVSSNLKLFQQLSLNIYIYSVLTPPFWDSSELDH